MITWKSVKKSPPPMFKEKDGHYRTRNLLVWVADANDGKGSIAHAHAYRLSTGEIRFSLFGFGGDWNITHWTEANGPKKGK